MPEPVTYSVKRHHIALGALVLAVVFVIGAFWSGLVSWNPDRARDLQNRAGIGVPVDPDPTLKAKADEVAAENARLKADNAAKAEIARLEAENAKLRNQPAATATSAAPGATTPQQPPAGPQGAGGGQPAANNGMVKAIEVQVVPLNLAKMDDHRHVLKDQNCPPENKGKPYKVDAGKTQDGRQIWDWYRCK